MAYTANTFQFNRGVTTCAANGAGVGTVIHGYKSLTDAYATIVTSGYFPANLDGAEENVFIGDTILIVASDTVGLALITSMDPFTVGANLLGTAGSPITMSVPVAALDANGIKITGTTVQLEIADATHPGIVTALDQVFAGIKMFNSGVQFLTFGGTPTTLNYNEEYTHNTTYTMNAETTASKTLTLARIGRVVTLTNQTFSTPGQGAPTSHFIANTVLPARFRPASTVTHSWLVENGGVRSQGQILILTDGSVSFYNDPDLTTAFTTAQINAVDQCSMTYIVA